MVDKHHLGKTVSPMLHEPAFCQGDFLPRRAKVGGQNIICTLQGLESSARQRCICEERSGCHIDQQLMEDEGKKEETGVKK